MPIRRKPETAGLPRGIARQFATPDASDPPIFYLDYDREPIMAQTGYRALHYAAI
jgi:hypothetical protein